MMYIRPDAGSLQKWADMVDDQSYTFDNMLPYFQKSCHFTPPDHATWVPHTAPEYNPNAYTPKGAPLQVSYYNNVRPFSTHLEAAFNEIGIPTTDDFNCGNLLGAQYCANTVDPTTATQSSAQTAFLEVCQARHNIKIFRKALAKKILFDEHQKATAVTVDSGL